MLTQSEFEKWIDATHNVFEIFEGRFDMYPICRKWIVKWYKDGFFNILEMDIGRLKKLKRSFDYSAFKVNDLKLQDRIDENFQSLIISLSNKNRCENIGLGIAPYFFTWNFQRFKKYFQKQENFNILNYFQTLGNFLFTIKNDLEKFSKKKLYIHEIEEKKIKEIFGSINNKLKTSGVGENEPIGTIKILHIFAPYYFPLLDNPIAETTGLKPRKVKVSISVSSYIRWMKSLREWIKKFDERKIEEIENRYKISILKLIDEGFYIMSSIKLSSRIKQLGLEIK